MSGKSYRSRVVDVPHYSHVRSVKVLLGLFRNEIRLNLMREEEWVWNDRRIVVIYADTHTESTYSEH